ncbi:hypothetical protein J2848_006482 [Azospirillum lipoferum]|uniref:DUF3990 domain-containing protein n=1 Tax=Azospirillum lipoferum TaxID=193 RepID=A0A5A9G9G8_AZOLI|nr:MULTISPECIES: hypothetical protein [Azospirillum]KAA0590364.1 hypothetical protein FZ942_31410 [Azospirillum lipoferum]MCP1614774.1 hypothetical protein [Azospirillum lipoferum]MDW5532229.1 hypothetical protein [Azospirillum sp. NL1]
MTELSNPFVLGYHGCRRTVGEDILAGKVPHLLDSRNKWDWLGSGVYFWEADPRRGYEWALDRYGPGEAFVIGAVIHLGYCLDLMSRGPLDLLKPACGSLVRICEMAGKPLPENRRTTRGPSHALDCAVINALHDYRATNQPEALQPFNTVRGLYQEEPPVFENSMIMSKTHVQICVRTPDESIKGYIRVPESQYLP